MVKVSLICKVEVGPRNLYMLWWSSFYSTSVSKLAVRVNALLGQGPRIYGLVIWRDLAHALDSGYLQQAAGQSQHKPRDYVTTTLPLRYCDTAEMLSLE